MLKVKIVLAALISILPIMACAFLDIGCWDTKLAGASVLEQ